MGERNEDRSLGDLRLETCNVGNTSGRATCRAISTLSAVTRCVPSQPARNRRRCMRRDAAAGAFGPNKGQDDITRPLAVAGEAGKPAVAVVTAVARSGAGLPPIRQPAPASSFLIEVAVHRSTTSSSAFRRRRAVSADMTVPPFRAMSRTNAETSCAVAGTSRSPRVNAASQSALLASDRSAKWPSPSRRRCRTTVSGPRFWRRMVALLRLGFPSRFSADESFSNGSSPTHVQDDGCYFSCLLCFWSSSSGFLFGLLGPAP